MSVEESELKLVEVSAQMLAQVSEQVLGLEVAVSAMEYKQYHLQLLQIVRTCRPNSARLR